MRPGILHLLEYFYWTSVILYIVFVIVVAKNKLFSKYSVFCVFAFVFLYLLFWVKYGFDITDEGYTLSKSWFLFHGMWKENVDIIFGSSFSNGLWLSILNKPSVLWARVGYVLVISTNSTIVYLILKKQFSETKSFIAVVLVTMISTSTNGECQTINYNNFPVLIILFSILLLLDGLKIKNIKLLFGSGFLIGISIISRITFISFALLPFMIFSYKSLVDINDKADIKKQMVYTYAGLVSGLVLSLIVIISTASLSSYLGSLTDMVRSFFGQSVIKSHVQNKLLEIYKDDFWLTFTKVLLFAFLFFVPIIISKSTINKYIKVGIYVVLGYLLFIYAYEKGDSRTWIYVIIASAITAVLFYLSTNRVSTDIYYLIICAWFMLFFSLFGSNIGIRMTLHSGSGMLALTTSFLILERLSMKIFDRDFSFKPTAYILIGFALILLFNRKSDDSNSLYRERPRRELIKKFETEALWGILSTPERVATIDSLLKYFKKIKTENRTVLTINSNPMFYFIANEKYYLSNPWFETSEAFEKKIVTTDPPDYLIFSKKNPRNYNWPICDTIPCDGSDFEQYLYFRNYAINNNYSLIYSDQMFDLFSVIDTQKKILSENLVSNFDMDHFVNGSPESWEKIRENSSVQKDSSIFHSKPYSLKVNAPDDVYAGICQRVLEVGQMYYCEAWIFTNKLKEFSIDIGGGASTIKKVLQPNTWTKISGYGRAVSPVVYIVATLGKNEGFVYYYDDVVVKKVDIINK